MRYVELTDDEDGYPGFIDPRPYLDRLPALAAELPPGARAFATDPGHYDFGGKRCVKDLRPERVRRTRDGDVEIRFRHNCFKHDEDLLVRYTGVSRFQSDVLGVCDPASLGDVILDEILPHPGGCTHELACRPGTLVVACRDLEAEWVPADCPDAPPAG
ncbi:MULTISPECIES: hypothetical protein [unclassified Streptomyces]|uniref:hypothetical protein n=1 Tax=unclassified Streptomyces TaxID=2593676 RepID=UPI0011AB2C5F|nr:hypothetical protein [Streptomyces sp. BK340]TVZ94160.1 hypothetical protein FB157_105228 [Streptomyces sp. BK340]